MKHAIDCSVLGTMLLVESVVWPVGHTSEHHRARSEDMPIKLTPEYDLAASSSVYALRGSAFQMRRFCEHLRTGLPFQLVGDSEVLVNT